MSPIHIQLLFHSWYRYTQGSGLSVWYDVATVTLLVTLLIYSYHQQGKIAWKYAKNILTFGGCIWAIYTAAEILNPTALTEAWVYSVEPYTILLSYH